MHPTISESFFDPRTRITESKQKLGYRLGRWVSISFRENRFFSSP
jgi:hypothetical protein